MTSSRDNSKQITTTLHVKNMVCNCCIRVLKEDFTKAKITIHKIALGQVEISYNPLLLSLTKIEEILTNIGFELIVDKEKILVEQIKISVVELIHFYNNANSLLRNSDYLIEKLGYSYPYLTSVFSKHENLTLEKYIILNKIEKVKELLISENITLSEISYMMGYGSVQYLSTQFKNITGVSVTDYKKNKYKTRKALDHLTE